ncbi:hypothetical protein Cgig2_010255 [Carnegiea gigantea]|uniref:Protein FAR1-RELATED SEQUENCE n=1 Tax=Carnegiea gigantea TaxID=171969 RepID=A0A9Q1QBA8_9CARY|nr:hypothetical protein Cgig2_010255 [Carnegiea gigantea]
MVMNSTNDAQFEVCTFMQAINISFIHKEFICKYDRANVGASKSLKEIPTCFIVDRWTKLTGKKCGFFGRVQLFSHTVHKCGSRCLDLARRDVDKFQYVINAVDSIQYKFQEVGDADSMSHPSTDLEAYFGYTVQDRVRIQLPPTSVTKGRGKRTKTGVKKAIEQQMHMRMCHHCKQVTSHDSRNYPEQRH